ncbi:lipase [Folsomia candida]|uniref:Lipase n=1 Tax=Folsomia candida TaxID=158441 RepID=A0A226DAZ0_FOLCA|nr:lipase [Folsomia candida]OXA42068.1 Lipase [Folsomia candida]
MDSFFVVRCIQNLKLLNAVLILYIISQPEFCQCDDAALTPDDIATLPITIASYGPDVARAKKYVYLSGAAYCFNIPAWKCPYCKKSQSFGYDFDALIVNKEANTLAFIAVNKKLKEIVVSYRGTLNMQNLVQDIHPFVVSIEAGSSPLERGKSKGPEMWVHTGMINATNSLYPEVVEKLGKVLKKNGDFDLVVIGHSLGAAEASLTLFLLKEGLGLPKDFPTPKSYAYFGYGTPRVGNKAYADYWNAQAMQITRVVNKADFAAYTPQALGGYVHNGNELWIMPTGGERVCSKEVYEDPYCANSMAALSNVHDHLHYWDVHFLSCAGADPVATAKQFVIDMPS